MKMGGVRDLRIRMADSVKSEAPEEFTPLPLAVTNNKARPISQLLAV